MKAKSRLLVNLPSPRNVQRMGIKYQDSLHTFASGITIDYEKLEERLADSIQA
jgi:hypothetical protein